MDEELYPMDTSKKQLLANYLSNISIDLSLLSYTRCSPDWKRGNFIPPYSKFYYIREGEGWLKIGKQEFYPKPGQLFLLPEGVLQSYSTINTNTFLKYWCHFTAKTGDINLFSIVKVPYYIDVQDTKYVEEVFRRMMALRKSDELTAKLKLKAEMSMLISYYLDSVGQGEILLNPSTNLTQLGNILEYIDENLSEGLTIQGLAKTFFLHPNSLARLFKAHIGSSPMQYLHLKTIDKAKHLLSSTDLSINEVASAVGFKDQFYFSKYFKKSVGFTPSEYRVITQNHGINVPSF